MTTYHPASVEVRAILAASGFAKDIASQSCLGRWSAADGRKAVVSYVLKSATGQSSRGASAAWQYALTIKGA